MYNVRSQNIILLSQNKFVKMRSCYRGWLSLLRHNIELHQVTPYSFISQHVTLMLESDRMMPMCRQGGHHDQVPDPDLIHLTHWQCQHPDDDWHHATPAGTKMCASLLCQCHLNFMSSYCHFRYFRVRASTFIYKPFNFVLNLFHSLMSLPQSHIYVSQITVSHCSMENLN